ncbi:hypothetical protein [Cellulomonas sp. URHE0023]|uniref:hypothetical protein n=1 Tax=Cellulomonas sp. URHE0023 TaxID=1380354 RepID=UPI000481EF92|nr:hypothetical protein [Cellulomonas sp. URHE0023]
MIDLPDPRPLSAERSRELREHLMDTMVADPRLVDPGVAARRTRPLVVGSFLVVLLVGLGLAAAVAITVVAVGPNGPEAVVVSSDALDVLYDGNRITQDDLVELTKVGKGTFTMTDVDTERDLRATRAFDTLEELDAYAAAYLAWQNAKADGQDVEAWGTVRP